MGDRYLYAVAVLALKRHEKELFRRWEQMQEWRKERS